LPGTGSQRRRKAGRPSDRLLDLEAALGVSFERRDLLERALVHRSYLNERADYSLGSNERLEFLGDAVLGFVVANHLYHSFPEMPEGELTALRARLVRQPTLDRVATRLGLGEHLALGRGEETTGGRSRSRLRASAFEALVGALFLDQGLETARELVIRELEPELALALASRSTKDDKSLLQEVTQAEAGVAPTYETVAEEGPHHARRFVVEVRAGERVLAEGSGSSKQEAEMAAAHEALRAWQSPIDARHPSPTGT
jgi:ribonuclease-3